jgi:hypothetical protein
MPILCILLPWNAPVEYWNESIITALLVVIFLRCTVALHCAMLINTAVYVWGIADGDKYVLLLFSFILFMRFDSGKVIASEIKTNFQSKEMPKYDVDLHSVNF